MTKTTFCADLLGRTFDEDELLDIARYGCSGGVSGFIYSSELYDVFSKYEDEIMDYLEEFAEGCYGTSAESMIVSRLDDEQWTMQEFRELAVWTYLEIQAQELTAE